MVAEKVDKPTPGQDPEADVPELNDPSHAPGDVAPLVDPSPRFHRNWRGGVAVAGLLAMIAGAWLIASPFVLDYVAGDSELNPMIVGAVVAFLALLRMGAWHAEWLAVLIALGGAWLFASGFWLAESPAASWNAWLLGMAVVMLALLGIDATEEGRMEDSPAAGKPLSLGER
jgi:hypothetical protein